jgi:hypothetical protein
MGIYAVSIVSFVVICVVGMKAPPNKQTRYAKALWQWFKILTVMLALASVFTVFAMLTAVESGVPLIYVELAGFLYYLTIGLVISWKNKR